MIKERIKFYKTLTESLRASVIMNPKITDRVKLFERVLLSEKVMAWMVGKTQEEIDCKLPQVLHQWRLLHKID